MPEPTPIATREELDAAFDASATRPVVLLKHSERCASSRAALRDLRKFAHGVDEAAALFVFLEVLSAADLSEDVTARTGVVHESPQLILLRNGRVAWHASRWHISSAALREALDAPARRE